MSVTPVGTSNIAQYGIKKEVLDGPKAKVVVCDNLQEALEYAKKDAGEEAIIKIKDESGKEKILVADIKAGTSASSFNLELDKSSPLAIAHSDNNIDALEGAGRASGFKYVEGKPNIYDKLSDAKFWSPGDKKTISGSAGNVYITNSYHEMDAEFTKKYLGDGVEGTTPSWVTFAKSGSGSAGMQVGNIETALEAIKQITNDFIEPETDAKATVALARVLGKPGMIGQFGLLAEQIVNKGGKGLRGIEPKLIETGLKDIQRLRTTLVEGNTEIYNNAIPVFRTFMQGESSGKGQGLKNVEQMINNPNGLWSDQSVKKQWQFHLGRPLNKEEEAIIPKLAQQNRDLIHKTFDGYKQAHNLSELAKSLPNPSKDRTNLLQKHDELIKQANLDFVSFEQLFAQPIYNKIHDLTGAMTGTVRLFDANNPDGQVLLPNLGADKKYSRPVDSAKYLAGTDNKAHDGNWGDWTTRMGYVPCKANDPGARKLTVPVYEQSCSVNPQENWFRADPKIISNPDEIGRVSKGTISDYFLTTKPGKETDDLINKTPPMAVKSFNYSEPSNRLTRFVSNFSSNFTNGTIIVSGGALGAATGTVVAGPAGALNGATAGLDIVAAKELVKNDLNTLSQDALRSRQNIRIARKNLGLNQ